MTDIYKTRDGRGYGLYARRHFSRGDRIGIYKGRRLSNRQLDNLYGSSREIVAEYAVRVGVNTVIDDYRREGKISFANDPVDLKRMHSLLRLGYSKHQAYDKATNKKLQNSELVVRGGEAVLYATKAIEPRDEIQWSYGVCYWLA
ncbi:MAG: SET domain-containing protein [Desulfosporosinus sp.]|nr:SET domain-containing protein [Desulfosporosinus sp.]